MQLKANPELMKPMPIPKANKGKMKKPISMYSPGGTELIAASEADINEPDEVRGSFVIDFSINKTNYVVVLVKHMISNI